MKRLWLVVALTACGRPHAQQNADAASAGDTDGGHGGDADLGGLDGGRDDGGLLGDGGPGDGGGGSHDAMTAHDAMTVHDAPTGIITGGPCLSGAQGATGYRVRWQNGGGTATVAYEENGLPDTSNDHTGAYGYQIGFSPSFVDPFLGDGGVALDDSDFIDIELSTVGISSISKATLSIYGRSYNTTASGSFNWQSLDDVGSTDYDFVSNVAPYRWYSADMTAAIGPAESGYRLRIKSGPASDALVVNRIELCLVAQ